MNEPLEVKLAMDEQTRSQLVSFETIMDVVNEFLIDSVDMANLANTELRAIKAKIVRVQEMRKGFTAPARQIIAHAEELFDPAIKALQQAEVVLKERLGLFAQAQQRLVDEERRKREAEERHIRQEAEAKAAAERAKAEEQAREMRRQADEAAEAQRKAVAEGNAKAAAKAAAESARLEEEARARQQEGEIKAAQTQLEAAASVQAQAPAAVAAKIDGFAMRDNWQVELERDEQHAVTQIAAVLASKPELVGLLSLNMSAANKMAKALKQNMNVPGLRAVNKQTAVSRKA